MKQTIVIKSQDLDEIESVYLLLNGSYETEGPIKLINPFFGESYFRLNLRKKTLKKTLADIQAKYQFQMAELIKAK